MIRNHLHAALAVLLTAAVALAAPQFAVAQEQPALELDFNGVVYQHRWSRAGQHEFTPEGQGDLAAWRDMLTINLHEQATSPEELAVIASRILDLYGNYGRVLRTDLVLPDGDEEGAEYFVAAVMGDPAFLEAVFARMMLHDEVAHIVVYSHRLYGTDVGAQMSEWLQGNGPQMEETLMAWDELPGAAVLRALPQSE